MAIAVTGEAESRVGHLVLCAGHATPDAVNFMATQGRGVVSLVISQADLERLQLPMQQRQSGPAGRAAPVSIEARSGVSTGISAADRARTIQVAADPASAPGDLVSPGHIFPLLAKEGGVFALPGPAEMAADLCRLAGFAGTSVICAILDDQGNQAGAQRLGELSTGFDLPIVPADELLVYRCRYDRQLEPVRERSVQTASGGVLRAAVYREAAGGPEVLALFRQTGRTGPSPVCVQQGLFLSNRLGSELGEGGFHGGLREIERRGHGALLVLGDRSMHMLSMSLDEEGEGKPIAFSGWGLAARVLSELGFANVELLDAPAGAASTLRQFGLHARNASPVAEQVR